MDKNNEPIYVIMVFEKCEKDDIYWIDMGCKRIVGFKHNLKSAKQIVIDNVCDICESCYKYALIEEVVPCVYPCNDKRWYFKYNKEIQKYEKIEEPEIFKNTCSITMG